MSHHLLSDLIVFWLQNEHHLPQARKAFKFGDFLVRKSLFARFAIDNHQLTWRFAPPTFSEKLHSWCQYVIERDACGNHKLHVFAMHMLLVAMLGIAYAIFVWCWLLLAITISDRRSRYVHQQKPWNEVEYLYLTLSTYFLSMYLRRFTEYFLCVRKYFAKISML